MAKFGKKLVERGLVEAHSGNISVRRGSRMLVTRSGASLDEIDENSVVEVEIDGPSEVDKTASRESIVHRAIYRRSSALAVIHAHCPFAVVESLLVDDDRIIPMDIEGRYYLHEIPLVKGETGSQELAENTASALKDHRGIIVIGHGTFAVGKGLEEAYVLTALIEHSCRLKYYYDLAGR
jgi:L-fuculose-phosphate aldolase